MTTLQLVSSQSHVAKGSLPGDRTIGGIVPLENAVEDFRAYIKRQHERRMQFWRGAVWIATMIFNVLVIVGLGWITTYILV